MDTIVVKRKLNSLREHVMLIEENTPDHHEDLGTNRIVQDAVVFNFCLAVQLCTDIALHAISRSGRTTPETMADSFADLFQMGVISQATSDTLKQMSRIRNIAMHAYQRLNLDIVHDACTVYLVTFKSFAQEVSHFLDNEGAKHKADQEPD